MNLNEEEELDNAVKQWENDNKSEKKLNIGDQWTGTDIVEDRDKEEIGTDTKAM